MQDLAFGRNHSPCQTLLHTVKSRQAITTSEASHAALSAMHRPTPSLVLAGGPMCVPKKLRYLSDLGASAG